MAKHEKAVEGGMVSSGGPVTATGADGAAGTIEQKMVDFAEDLGSLLGSAEKRASEWLSQRQAVADQLTKIRDTANELLTRLTGTGANVVAAVERRRRRGRPPGSVNRTPRKRGPGRPKGSAKGRRKMSADARARIAAAQKARWAKVKAQKG